MKTCIVLVLGLLVGIVLGLNGQHYLGRVETFSLLLSALPVFGTLRNSVPSPPVATLTDEHDHDHDKDEQPEVPQSSTANPLHDHSSAKAGATPGKQSKDDHAHGNDKPTHSRHENQGKKTGKTDHHAHSNEKHAQGRHNDHDDDHDEKTVRLSAEQLKQFGITVAVAQAGNLTARLSLPGTVTMNTDRRVDIVPRVPGLVREVRKNLGDAVRAGEVLAILESRDLADAKAAYLAAYERASLAEITFTREKGLWEKQISPEEDFLKAKQALAESRIELRLSSQKLLALGVADATIKQLVQQTEAPLTPYEIVAPFAGTVVEKHIAVGTFLKDDRAAFAIADLSTVWVDLAVPPKDVPLLRKGQRITIAASPSLPEAAGTLSYVSPMVAEETRTVMARVVLPNPDGRWRPGAFISATLSTNETPVAVLIPSTAVQTLEGQPTVFVQTAEGFEPRLVTLGRADTTHTEITSGLRPGERYAATDTFLLKAEVGKATAGHQH